MRRRGLLVRGVVAVVVSLGFVAVLPVRPAAASELGLTNAEIVPGKPGGGGQRISYGSATMNERHPIGITMPPELANLFNYVIDGTCTGDPRNGSLQCRPNYPSTASMWIAYNDPFTLSLDGQTFTVGLTDTVTNESTTGSVHIRSSADLDLGYFGIFTAGVDATRRVWIRVYIQNHGPSQTGPITLRVAFTGNVAFGQLPSSCSPAAAVVTCALPSLTESKYTQFDLTLAPSSGPLAADGAVSAQASDPNTSNNIRATEPGDYWGNNWPGSGPTQPNTNSTGAPPPQTGQAPASSEPPATSTPSATITTPDATEATTPKTETVAAPQPDNTGQALALIAASSLIAIAAGIAIHFRRRRTGRPATTDPAAEPADDASAPP